VAAAGVAAARAWQRVGVAAAGVAAAGVAVCVVASSPYMYCVPAFLSKTNERTCTDGREVGGERCIGSGSSCLSCPSSVVCRCGVCGCLPAALSLVRGPGPRARSAIGFMQSCHGSCSRSARRPVFPAEGSAGYSAYSAGEHGANAIESVRSRTSSFVVPGSGT
jgi:hypothetical protein